MSIFCHPWRFFSDAPPIRWLSRALLRPDFATKEPFNLWLIEETMPGFVSWNIQMFFSLRNSWKIFLKLETPRKGTSRIILIIIRGHMARAPEIIVKVNWTQCTTHCSHLCEINRKIWSMDDWHWLCVNDSKRGEHRKDANCIFGLLMPSSTPV